jgi:hypothetical protein
MKAWLKPKVADNASFAIGFGIRTIANRFSVDKIALIRATVVALYFLKSLLFTILPTTIEKEKKATMIALIAVFMPKEVK